MKITLNTRNKNFLKKLLRKGGGTTASIDQQFVEQWEDQIKEFKEHGMLRTSIGRGGKSYILTDLGKSVASDKGLLKFLKE